MYLDIGTKKRVHHRVRCCAFELKGMPTPTHLNVIPFGSYSMILGMDWIYLHRMNVYCYDKAIEYLDDNGEKRILHRKKKPTSVIMVTTM